MRIPPPLAVDERDADVLRGWIAGGPPSAVRRARIVLLSGAALGPSAIARELGCSKQTVITWRERYRTGGVDGLRDAPRSGRPATVDAAAVIRRTLEVPEPATARWSTRTLAAEIGISNVAVANIWRAWGIVPGIGGRVRLATEPALESPLSAVAGLYLDRHVRMLAVLVGGDAGTAGDSPAVPIGRRPGVGSRLAELDEGVAGESDPAGRARFLTELAEIGTSHRIGLLVDGGSGEAQGPWTEPIERAGAVLHRGPPGVSWDRLVRVACLLAGASTAGVASVVALRDAAGLHPGGRPFAWTSRTVASDLQ